MKELKDSGIKLFGMSIALPESEAMDCEVVVVVDPDHIASDSDRSSKLISCLDDKKVSRVVGEDQEAEKEPMVKKPPHTKKQDLTSPLNKENSENQEVVSELHENLKMPSSEQDNIENDQSDTNDSQQKTLKKPDKIIPCPRCNSMDTKFCYYNNYNVNQPRHFCKSCQRYWTSGGTMRNVPVGAGRRKNKNSNSSCRHITISEVLQAAQIDLQNGIQSPSVKTNGILSFGSDPRFGESIASVLNLPEKKAPNGLYKIQQGDGENGDDCSSGSLGTTSNSMENGSRNCFQDPTIRSMNGLSSQIPCLPGVPWPYPWNSAVPIPAFCPPGFPISFYPPPYWNSGFPGTWAIPCLAPITPNTPKKSTNPDTNSPILGKHSREGDLVNPINPEGKEPIEKKSSERSVLIPKTLRIDDPDEAAKSSIWATLGIKNDSINRGGIFNGFEPKGEKKIHVAKTFPSLWANPAAFSRSLTFQES